MTGWEGGARVEEVAATKRRGEELRKGEPRKELREELRKEELREELRKDNFIRFIYSEFFSFLGL
jgi:hypothetical protein